MDIYTCVFRAAWDYDARNSTQFLPGEPCGKVVDRIGCRSDPG